jgi:hypothetical protein
MTTAITTTIAAPALALKHNTTGRKGKEEWEVGWVKETAGVVRATPKVAMLLIIVVGTTFSTSLTLVSGRSVAWHLLRA